MRERFYESLRIRRNTGFRADYSLVYLDQLQLLLSGPELGAFDEVLYRGGFRLP